MIDIHAHILPRVDDGAASLVEAVEMAKIAVDSGIHTVVATPHGNLFEQEDGHFFEESRKNLEKALKQEGIDLTVVKGMEVFASYEVVDLLKEGSLQTINDTNYFLMEFDFEEKPWFVEDIISESIEAGFQPIIAHPARYTMVQQDPNIVMQWIDMGAKIQLNRGSLLGRFGPVAEQTAYVLLTHQMVHFVASDCHSATFRTPILEDVKEFIQEVTSDEYADLLLEENPFRMIHGQDVVTPMPLPVRKRKVW